MDPSKPPPADNPLMILLVSAAILIMLSMLFSISESSFLSINKLRLRSKINRKDKKAIRAGRLLDNKEQMLNTLLVANEAVNVLLSAILTSAALKLFGAAGVGIATFITTILLLIFGEITPKAVSTRHPDTFAYNLSLFVKITVTILAPIIPLFTFISRLILRLFGIQRKKVTKSFTEEEIKTILDIGSEEGIIGKSEKTMMQRVFKFTDLEAQNIMIPRTHIIALPYNAKYRDILELSERSHLSRFPIYKKDIDDIIGILYIKDLLSYDGLQKDFNIQNFMRPPLFIPGSKSISYAQHLLTENHQSIAIVIDEYSGTDGILTKEDIVTEIFGSVKHDSNKNKSFSLLNKIDQDVNILIPGETRLIDLNEALNISLSSEFNETLGGWIAEQLDRLPDCGDSVDNSGFTFTVESISARRVDKVQITNENQDFNTTKENNI